MARKSAGDPKVSSNGGPIAELLHGPVTCENMGRVPRLVLDLMAPTLSFGEEEQVSDLPGCEAIILEILRIGGFNPD